MSNIAGKAYAMNVVTPIKWYWAIVTKIIFWFMQLPVLKFFLTGLVTLSMIHYARWVIVKPSQFPRLDPSQPKEIINYNYMFFFSNFNGSWEQYVDSFHSAIPKGLNMFWFKNVGYPGSVPLHPFYAYITFNQIWTNHYYSAYPIATCNDVKAAQTIKSRLNTFIISAENLTAQDFFTKYQGLLRQLQNDISVMRATPIVSLSAEAVASRRNHEHNNQ